MKEHVLKTHSLPFQAVWDGRKLYEVRVNDRDYKIGEHVVLREYTPGAGYSTRSIQFIITYITPGGSWGLPDDLCILGFNQVVKAFDEVLR